MAYLRTDRPQGEGSGQVSFLSFSFRSVLRLRIFRLPSRLQ